MKEKIRRFEDLIAWQKARAFAREIYCISSHRPFSRDFPIRNQICGAALSVPSNIAEGFERDRLREFHQFLSIAKRSCAEDVGLPTQTSGVLQHRNDENSRR